MDIFLLVGIARQQTSNTITFTKYFISSIEQCSYIRKNYKGLPFFSATKISKIQYSFMLGTWSFKLIFTFQKFLYIMSNKKSHHRFIRSIIAFYHPVKKFQCRKREKSFVHQLSLYSSQMLILFSKC
jgi:hypothetical protein